MIGWLVSGALKREVGERTSNAREPDLESAIFGSGILGDATAGGSGVATDTGAAGTGTGAVAVLVGVGNDVADADADTGAETGQ